MTLADSAKERISIQDAYEEGDSAGVVIRATMSKDAYLTHLGNSQFRLRDVFPADDHPAELTPTIGTHPFLPLLWVPTPDKPDSPLNKELPLLRTVPIEVPYWPMAPGIPLNKTGGNSNDPRNDLRPW
jgi:hypothetical protein